jgi:hypothetical protein
MMVDERPATTPLHSRRATSISPEMIYGMTDGGAHRATAHTSTTMLTGCLRQTRLQQEVDYHVELRKLFPALRGAWGHLMTEVNPVPGTIYEARFELPFELNDGRVVTFTGQGDALDLVLKCYRDFKTKAAARYDRRKKQWVYKPLPNVVSPEYQFQLNAYRMLFYLGSPQQAITTDAFGDPLPGGAQLYPGVPAQIELDWHELFMWTMNEPKRYPCPQIDYHQMYDEVLRRLEILHGPELPPVPDDRDPLTSPICTEWCPAEIRAACLAALGDELTF